jgi:hypothetical protein
MTNGCPMQEDDDSNGSTKRDDGDDSDILLHSLMIEFPV